MTVGNRAGAQRAIGGDLEAIGGGTTRTVYRAGDVVYKVETDQGRDRHSNSHEHANADRFEGHVGVPPTTLYSVGEDIVLAMPFYPVPVEDGLGNESEREALDRIFDDVAPGNLRRDERGDIWLIDLVHAKPDEGAQPATCLTTSPSGDPTCRA